jgi:hypothetical protein
LTGRRTLVIGGSAFALGYAHRHSGQALILERGVHLAPEFSLMGETDVAGVPSTEYGRELTAALSKVGLLEGTRLELPPLSDFICDHFAQLGIKAFMNAEAVDLVRKGGKWQATIIGGGGEGLFRMDFDAVLDTTDLGWKEFGQCDVIGKRFSAVTTAGRFTVDLPADSTWRDARLALYEKFEADPLARTGHILAEAGAIRCCYRPGRIEKSITEGFCWIPSGQFGHLVTAYEEGMKWSFR